MKFASKSLWSVVLALGLAGAIATTIARGQAAPAASNPPPTKLAVINIVELFDKLDEKAAADDYIDNLKKDYEAAARKKQSQIDVATESLDKTYRRGTPEFRKAQEDLLRMTVELQVQQTVDQQKLFMELRIRTADLYNKINDAVKAYSETNGIALVFVTDNPSVEGARTQEQLQAMVTVRKILYAHPSFDITKAILTKMNTDYQLAPHPKSSAPASRP
jgi:Skp family chaperone for outer membrane proteins